MATPQRERSISASGLLTEGYIRFERFFGFLDPVAVIERQYFVANPSEPFAPDADFLSDYNALEIFSAGVRVIAAHSGCVSQFFAKATIYDLDKGTVGYGSIHYYGIRVLPRTDQTAEVYYGNLRAMQKALKAEDMHVYMKAAIKGGLSDGIFDRYMIELKTGLAQSIKRFDSS